MSFVLGVLLFLLPFVLASTITAISEALRGRGVKIPRIMRAGPWRSE
ncbi:MAG: hypothetical protein M3Y87_12520 [Myxococcota bacterium]|nr:hypothetical protein [Myxococcota bacterium]